MVSTTLEIPAYRIEGSFGVVRGIVARSRSVAGPIGASLQTIFGGNITLYTALCERARRDAYERMVAEAEALGADAIVGMRYDATEIARGISEVLCDGTAVHVRRSPYISAVEHMKKGQTGGGPDLCLSRTDASALT